MKQERPVLCLILVGVLLSCTSIACIDAATTRNSAHKRPSHHKNVDETTQMLFSHNEDPLSLQDKWAILSHSQRAKWSQSHNLLNSYRRVADILDVTATIRKSKIHADIDVQIVSPPNFVSSEHLSLISTYSSAMRAGNNGTVLNFQVSLAPEKTRNRVMLYFQDHSNHEAHLDKTSRESKHLLSLLQHSSVGLSSLNVLYVVIEPRDAPHHSAPETYPVLQSSRTALFQYNVAPTSPLSVTHLLTAIETVSERVFSPAPLYFPIPLLRQVEVSVTAYTPEYALRAPWLDDFRWDYFETAVRSFALPGQKIIFSSSQTNAGCSACMRAFESISIHDSAELFVESAVAAMSQNEMPNSSWPTVPHDVHHVPNALHSQTTALNTARLIVVDTSKLKQTEALRELEHRAVFTFPGTAVLFTRSSDHAARATLQKSMIIAFIASVYGIKGPEAFLSAEQLDLLGSATEMQREVDEAPTGGSMHAPVLNDVIARSVVRSVVEKRLEQLDEMVDGMVYFEVDPRKSLDEDEVIQFQQRVNVLLFKLQQAQQVLSESYDRKLAVFLVASTGHDMQAIRQIFDMDDEKRVMSRFRDPTVRCHFSRLKRGAIRATEILEMEYPYAEQVLVVVGSFSASVVLTRILLWQGQRKPLRKTE